MVSGTEKQPIEVDYQVGFSGCRKGCIQYLMILVIQGVAKNFRGGGMIIPYLVLLLERMCACYGCSYF